MFAFARRPLFHDSRATKRLLHAVTIVSVLPLLATADRIRLAFDPAQLQNTSQVQFKADDLGDAVVPSAVAKKESAQTATSNSGRFVLVVDIGAASFTPIAYYTFEVFLKDLTQKTSTEFRIQAFPKGSFADQYGDVSFQIVKDGKVLDTGSIKLPLYNVMSHETALSFATSDGKDLTAEVASINRVRIQASIKPDQLPIELSNLQVRSVGDCWDDVSIRSSLPVRIGVGGPSALEIAGHPRLIKALLKSIIHRDGADDTLILSGVYRSLPNGPERSSDFSIPVKFEPSFITLGSACLLGCLAAITIISFLDPKYARPKALLGSGLLSILLALFAEIIGIAAVQAGSKLVLFNLTLDPAAIPGSLIVGLLAGFIATAKRERCVSTTLRHSVWEFSEYFRLRFVVC